jgi:hypothetical protein
MYRKLAICPFALGSSRSSRFKKMRYEENSCRVELRPILDREFAQPEVHQLFAGGDWQLSPGFKVNLGVGFDLGSRGPGVVLKSCWERGWAGKPKP